MLIEHLVFNVLRELLFKDIKTGTYGCLLSDIANNEHLNNYNLDFEKFDCIESNVSSDKCAVNSTIQFTCRNGLVFEDSSSKYFYTLVLFILMVDYISYNIIEESIIKCLPNGKWTQSPKCVTRKIIRLTRIRY